MRKLVAFALLLGSFACMPAMATCPPDGQSRESLEALKASKFTVPDAKDRVVLAMGLVDCLADPDPALRDGIAYEALAHWMREGQLDELALRMLRDELQGALTAEDPEGFKRPFAALVLSEVARTDRIAPWMTPEERGAMVESAARYMASIEDYRGFDNAEGWRHGVAHASDWLMQLALNPALDRGQLDRILSAVATQVVPSQPHAYVFGEPGRLARPVLYVAKRGLHTEAEWTAWMSAFAPKLGDAKLAYTDEAWLAKRHDLLAFLTALYLEADRSEDAQLQALEAPVVAGIRTVP